jgi:chitinase
MPAAPDATVSTWRIEFDLPSGTTISSFWDADVTSSGNHYVAVKKSWAGGLAPARPLQLGLQRHRGVQGAVELHHQRRVVRRLHPDHQCAVPDDPPTASPTVPDGIAHHDPPPAGGTCGGRLLRRVGRLRPELP